MKKRRVLALFLALSMTLSSNGFTALAAENDSVVAIEADLSEGTDETDGENIASDANDENGNNAPESEGGAQDNTGGNGDASEGERDVYEGGNASENNGETGDNTSGENVENEDGISNGSGEDGDNASEENDETEDSASEENGENGDDAEAGNDTDATEAGDAEALAEELDSVEVYEPLMRTFTDETGMMITYDAREADLYNYEVKDGVLTKVTRKDDKEISGNVELKQADTPYHTIGANIFGDDVKNKIEYVILPSGAGITKIGDNAFADYKNLRGITLPVDMKQIGKSAFEGCTNMTQLSIPKAVESIGDSAFAGDTSLFMVYIRDYTYSNMKSIGNSAFYNCQRLEKFGSDMDFVLPGYLETIGDSAFGNCRVIKKITLPDTVVTLGDSAFKDCRGLMELNLSGVSDIQKHAFEGCNSLLSVIFSDGNTKIDEYAFADCYGLAELKLVDTITNIGNYAFSGCRNLRYVKFENSNVVIGSVKAFPNDNEFPLWMRGKENSNVHEYVKDHKNMRFIINDETTDEYFKYKYDCLGYKDNNVDLKFACADQKDPNESNQKKGVKSGVEIIVSIIRPSTVSYVEGSLKCNGTTIKKNKNGDYAFKMPVGGAYVTAEFERKNDSEVIGNANNLTYQLSNGTALKVGQTTRMFIIDKGNDNSIVDFSRIKFETSDAKVATVSKDGTIKAIKRGTAFITAIITLDVSNKKYTSQEVTIQVEDAEVDSLKLKPMSYDTRIMKKVENDLNEITGFYLKKASVENNETTFVLMATAYDKYEDNISVDLKWSTSDSKVAKLAKTSTNSSDSQNTITIPKGASGAATITATATIGSGSDQIKKLSKFTVCVQDSAPRLSTSIITLNPYHKDGAALDIISAYGVEIVKDSIQLRRNENKDLRSQYFDLVEAESNDGNSSIVKFRLESRSANIKDGTYQELVYVEVNDNYEYLPLTIKVKRSIPNPTVTFDKKKEKINLFYANGNTVVEPVIGNLGNVEIEKFELRNLSTGTDDSKFDKNFEIAEETDTSCVIQRSSEAMQYTSKNKPVVTGYLVLTFKGYKEGVNTKEYKITIPANTVKPSYKLESTSNTFSSLGEEQTVAISLIDKKTNKNVDLNEGSWDINKDISSTSTAVRPSSVRVDENGKISMDVNPKGSPGKVIISVRNEGWDGGQYLKYTYNVKISNKKPTFKLSKSSVTLNKYFEGSEARFTITPNQYGITVPPLSDNDFIRPANLNKDKEEQYDKIKFGWDNEKKEVTVKLNSTDIKNGSYKFTCYPIGENGGKITITVKVTGVLPTVSLKGSANLNLTAEKADTAELTVNIRNLPDGGSLNDNVTASNITCVTNRDEDAADYFNFEIVNKIENKKEVKKLKINIQNPEEVAAKTYTFSMTPSYVGYDISENAPKAVNFKVKVYSKSISVSLKAKGKINLLQRFDDEDFVRSNNADTGAVSYNAAKSILALENTATPDFDGNGDGDSEITTPGSGDGTSGTEGGSGSGAEGGEDNSPKSISISYEYTSTEVDLKVKVDSEDERNIDSAKDAITIDENKKPTSTYLYTATALKGYKVTSLKAYGIKEDSSKVDLSTVTPNIEENDDTITLTIDSNVSLEGISSISIEVESASLTEILKPPVNKYNITLAKPVGVEKLEYSLFDDGDEGFEISSISFEEYKDSIETDGTKKLAVKVTPINGYSIVAVKAAMKADETEQQSKAVELESKGDSIYISNDKISADTIISIEVKYENGKKVIFKLNGNHTRVKKNFGDDNVIADEANDTTTAEGYTFCIEKEEGYDANVEVYTVAEGQSTQTRIEEITPTPDSEDNKKETYVIPAEKIIGDITIVVTDVYTITLDDKTTSVITELSYKVGDAADYTEYKSDEKIKVTYGESLSFKFTKSGEAIIVVLDEEGNKLSESLESAENSKAYTIGSDKIKGNKTITIATAYEIIKAIDKEAGLDMASVTYTDNSKVITDDSRSLIIAGQDLEFTVAAESGYAIKEVNYAIGTNPADTDYQKLTADADSNVYKIAAKDITGNVSIKVTVKAEDEDNYIVKFSLVGASVTKINEDGTQVKNPESVKIPKAGEKRSFTFTVETTGNNKLRYVGTNPDLETISTDISKAENIYTFTLPENPRAVTTVYVKADAPKTDLKVRFRAFLDGVESTSSLETMVSTVTFANVDKTQVTKKPILATGYADESYTEDGEVSFIIASLEAGYTLGVTSDGKMVSSEKRQVTVNGETEAKEVTIYTLSLKDIAKDVTVDISVTSASQGGDELETPQSKYTLKNSIVYTPVVSNLKDTVVDAKIYDVTNDAEPDYADPTSQFFNIEVIDGLLYVTPKKDAGEELDEWDYIKNNTTYTLRIWLGFDKYKSGIEEDGNGVWVAKPIKIKTAQVLPKVVTDTNTLNLYQSNPNYTATFYVRLKDAKNSIGEIESIDFGEKDEKAIESFNWELREIQEKDGSLKVTISINGSSQYPSNSTNKVKMYVKFKNQARNTAGTAITMNIKVNK